MGLTIGDFIDVTLEAETLEGALSLPASALFAQNKVWVIENNVLASRFVTVVSDDDGMLTIEGIDIGDGVVVLPPSEAYEGMEVSAREDAPLVSGGAQNAAQ